MGREEGRPVNLLPQRVQAVPGLQESVQARRQRADLQELGTFARLVFVHHERLSQS
jgi:hypothetical protein